MQLQITDALPIGADIAMIGGNGGAFFDTDIRVFHPTTQMTLVYLKQEYTLLEYHYHMPATHTINGVTTVGELHMVFTQGHFTGDICGVNVLHHDTDRVVVVCYPLVSEAVTRETNLSLEPAITPTTFFHYDTVLSNIRVRMVVSDTPLEHNMKEVYMVCKRGHPCKPYDGRILLHSQCEPKEPGPLSYRSKSIASASETSRKSKSASASESSSSFRIFSRSPRSK